MPLPNHIQALVFDAYGTLFNVASLDEGLALHFDEKASAINAVWRKKQLEYTWLRTLMNKYKPFSSVTKDALLFACESLEISISDSQMSEMMQRYFSLSAFPEIATILEALSAQHKLAVLSNANPDMLNASIRFNQLEKLISHIISADAVQQFKPRPDVYRLAETELGLDRKNIGFISSNTWDVAGAKSFGLFAIWLDRGTGIQEKLDAQANMTITQLSQLLISP
ncbi:UNVERIFIED_CONTAM: hypothetical protein GTU68_044087 [Idotea baltica]|nr:hypothetical protein [Idotea baltica]